jgi:hypothetical protein
LYPGEKALTSDTSQTTRVGKESWHASAGSAGLSASGGVSLSVNLDEGSMTAEAISPHLHQARKLNVRNVCPTF